MKPVLYLYRSCSSCRNAERLLEDAGVTFETREFFKQRFSKDELKCVLRHGGMDASELISTRSKSYKIRGLDQQTLSEDEMLDQMVDEPRLLKRPILMTDAEVIVGFNRDRYQAVASTLAVKQR